MTPEQIAGICDQLAEGKSLRAICREMEVPESTVRYHLNDEANFAQYTRARELQADSYFDSIVGLADNTDPNACTDREDRKMQIEARKWAAGKLKGKYSDKVKHVGGDDDDNPIAFKGWDISFGT